MDITALPVVLLISQHFVALVRDDNVITLGGCQAIRVTVAVEAANSCMVRSCVTPLMSQWCWCHRYDKFSFDITTAVEGHPADHQHEVLVQVFDPTGDF